MKFEENEYTELKKSTSELKEAIISACAILNKHGNGNIYFGIKNDGSVVGQQVSEKTLRDVSHAFTNNLEPKIYPKIKKIILNGKNCIKIDFEGNEKPYFAFGRAYIRTADEDKQITPSELKKLFIQQSIYEEKWDSKLSKYKISDIHMETYIDLLTTIKTSARTIINESNPQIVLNKLSLVEKNKLTYAAWYLLCDNQPVEIQTAVFAGNDKTTFLDIKKFNGSLYRLLGFAEQYLKEKINWSVKFGELERKEIPEIPFSALRETLVNSLVHRDMSNPKGNEIAIFKDRIEIYNPGSFPPGLTPDDFIRGEERSYLRNPKIAEIFYLTKDIEKWGSGLKRISDECSQAGVNVKFNVIQTGFLTTFQRAEIKKDKSGKGIGTTQKDSKKTAKPKTLLSMDNWEEVGRRLYERLGEKYTDKFTEKNTENAKKYTEKFTEKYPEKDEKFTKKFTGNQVKIYIYMKNDPNVTADFLSNKLQISKRAVINNINKLKKLGIIKRVGPAKGGHWEIILEVD